MMAKIMGKSKGGKIRLAGSPFQKGIGPGLAIIRTSKQFSEEQPLERIHLKMAQSHRARKAAKPTLPKLPWSD
jgi:hypothetical protein